MAPKVTLVSTRTQFSFIRKLTNPEHSIRKYQEGRVIIYMMTMHNSKPRNSIRWLSLLNFNCDFLLQADSTIPFLNVNSFHKTEFVLKALLSSIFSNVDLH